jgi:hypothetical protein
MRDDDFCAFRGIAIWGKGNGWVDVDVLWCWREIVRSVQAITDSAAAPVSVVIGLAKLRACNIALVSYVVRYPFT